MKKRILIPALLLIGAVMFCGCADTKEKNKAETNKKDMFYIYLQDGKDVYAFDGRSEKNKIGSDIMSICYEDSINSFITLNNNNDLCKIDSSNNKEKLCSDACFDYKITEEGDIYFINKDSDLYVKKKDVQDKEKVSSNVASYEIDGDSIVYVDNDNNLFIKNKDADKNKICSDVNSYKMSNDNNYAAYSSDNELYLKDIAKDEKEKICDDFQSESFTFADSDSIVYLDEYNAEKQKGELYYKKYGSEKKKLADDVTYIMADVDGAYYINEDKSLYYKKYDKDDKVKILDDAEALESNYAGVYVQDKDKNIYIVKSTGEKEKVVQDVQSYIITDNNVASLNSEKTLYYGNKKLADKVQGFAVNGDDVAFINEAKEIYLSIKGEKPEKVISDTTKYSKIEFNGTMLFQNKLGAEDIAGCYKFANPQTKEEVYLKFNSNTNITLAGFDLKEVTEAYTIDSSDINFMKIVIDGEYANINRKDNGTFTVDFGIGEVTLQKISAEEYKNNVAFAEKLYDKAIEIYGEEMAFFDKVVTINNMNYYVYNTEEGDESTGIYIDSSANVYVDHGNGLVPYGAYDTNNAEVSTDTFSEDKALQYARSYCKNNYGMNDSIDLMIGDSGTEKGMQYYRIKLTDTYAASQGGTGSMGWIKVYEDGTAVED